MENPASVVKAAIQPGTIIKWFVGGLVGFAALDLLGWTDYLLYPVSSLKARFGKSA